MSDVITNRVRSVRDAAGWTQQELADAAGISRQSLSAIESGKTVPSTEISLRLARALDTPFEDLFALTPQDETIEARTDGPLGGRVVMGRVGESWVAHRVGTDAPTAADGVADQATADRARVRALRPESALAGNILVAGCAPALGTLGARVGERPGAGRVRWLPRPSSTSVDLLERGLVHVAGLHLLDEATGEYNTPVVRRELAKLPVRVITLARWRQGLVVAPDNPRGIERVIHLSRPGVRVVRRPHGSGAQQLMDRSLRDAGIDLDHLEIVAEAADHATVARIVSVGLADVGPCIESVALEYGLRFIPLAEERFDIVVPLDFEALPTVRAFLQEIDTTDFRRELDATGGYDTSHTGHEVEVVR